MVYVSNKKNTNSRNYSSIPGNKSDTATSNRNYEMKSPNELSCILASKCNSNRCLPSFRWITTITPCDCLRDSLKVSTGSKVGKCCTRATTGTCHVGSFTRFHSKSDCCKLNCTSPTHGSFQN